MAKIRWIPFIIMCLVVGFIFGLQSGSAAEAERLQTRQEIQIFTQTAIAVVNADAGAETEDGRLNYSAAIIDTLGNDFSLASLSMANTGLENGTYGAVVIFPADVSEKIWSFNSKEPEKVQLEYHISPNLSEKDYLETYMKIMNLKLSINTTLASTYVSSIFTQFQQAQDKVDGVFLNDASDLSALDMVMLSDFSSYLEREEIPDIPLEPEPLDTESYFTSVTGFAESVAGMYLNSYSEASGQYLNMREGLFQLTDDFPRQEEEWMKELSEWSAISVVYGMLLESYAADVQMHEDELADWHMEIETWFDGVKKYQSDLLFWHGVLEAWFNETGAIKDVYQLYLDEAVAFLIEVTNDYRTALAGDTEQAMIDLHEWLEELEGYADDLLSDRQRLNNWRTTANNSLRDFRNAVDSLPAVPNSTGYTDDPDGYTQALNDYLVQLQNIAGTIPDLLTLAAVPSIVSQLPEYEGAEIPDEIDEEILQPETEMPVVKELELPPGYNGSDEPDIAEKREPIDVEHPENPLVDPPPRPDDFWASLTLMHNQLSSFNVDDYLTDDIRQQISVLLDAYNDYLSTVRTDLSFQFDNNVFKLHDVRMGYTEYLSNLRSETMQSETAARDGLRTTLEEYALIKESNSNDTQDRLYRFVNMMPESRSPAGLNRNLVGFTVEPFEIKPPSIRVEDEVVPLAQVPMTYIHSEYLRIALWVTGAVLLLTIASYGVTYFRQKRKSSGE